MYGIFISHKSKDWALAGRIYDCLSTRGYCPFLDVESLRQGDFDDALKQQIQNTPYFLLLLTPNTFKSLSNDNWVIKEIRIALKSSCSFIMIATTDFKWPEQLPKDIESIRSNHIYFIDRLNFFDIMKKLTDSDLSVDKIVDIIDWQKKANFAAQTLVCSRETMEKQIATLEARFGAEFISCIKSQSEFTGENRIKSIRMSCYAASLVFAPQINMVDERAFDRGVLFNVLAELLKDDEFSLEIIITAPDSFAAAEAIENEKLGNGRLEEYPEAIFLSSYCNIYRLIEQDPIFIKAKKERRFKFMVTEMALPYAIFQTVYKTGYTHNDHIKLDLYSEGLTSNMDRRSMIFFRDTDPENYTFFDNRYQYIRRKKHSDKLIKEKHDIWMKTWEKLKDEIDYEEQ